MMLFNNYLTVQKNKIMYYEVHNSTDKLFIWFRTWLIPQCSILLKKWTIQLVKKFPLFTEHEDSLLCSQKPTTYPYHSPDQSYPNLLYLQAISTIILPSHLCLGLLGGLFPSYFPTKILHASLFCPICSTHADHLSNLDFTILLISGEVQKLWSSSSPCSSLQFPVTSCLPGPNIFLSIVFLNTISLCSYLNVYDHVSYEKIKWNLCLHWSTYKIKIFIENIHKSHSW